MGLRVLENVESGGRVLKHCGQRAEGDVAAGWICFVVIALLGIGAVGGIMFWVYLLMEFIDFIPLNYGR